MKYEIKTGTACNNNCIFCLNSKRDTSLPKEVIKKTINEVYSKGIDCVQFTGGEITIRRDLFELMSYVKNAGLSVELQTNGRAFFYEKFAKEVVKQGVSWFLVSLHAHNEKLYRELSGVEGGYRQVVEGIKNLIELGQNVSINIVVSQKNVKLLPEIVRHHAALKPAVIQLSWLRPEGKVLDNIELLPKYSENIDFLKKAIDEAKKNSITVGVIGVPLCILGNYEKYAVNPYKNTVASKGGRLGPADLLFTEQKKIFVNVCRKCEKSCECGGIFKMYVNKNGENEFKPVINEETKIRIVSNLTNDCIERINMIKIGYGSKTYSAESKNKKYFVKERTKYFCDENLSELFKKTVSKAGVSILAPKIKKVFDDSTIEIYDYIEDSPLKTREEKKVMIEEFAELIGKLHKFKFRQESNRDCFIQFEQLADFAIKFNHLDENDKEKIITLIDWIKINRNELTANLIHNDLHRSNFIIQNKKIKYLTDFDKVKYSYTSYDASVFIYDMCYIDGEFDIEMINAFKKAYKKYATGKDVEALFPFLVFRGIDLLFNLLNASSEDLGKYYRKIEFKSQLKKLRKIIFIEL